MSKKRAREISEQDDGSAKKPRVNEALVLIWDQLADDDEDIRIDAASRLVSEHLYADNAASAEKIARRLFRGLCSNRKGARPGFYVALVAALSMKPYPFSLKTMSTSRIIDILADESVAESNTSGQDERDHYFGRLLGCKAIIDSKIMFNSQEEGFSAWNRLLDVMCNLAVKKPWLRQEIGWVLCQFVRAGHADLSTAGPGYFKATVSKFKEYKIVRSPEGLAIYLSIQRAYPSITLPKEIWKFDDPLFSKDVQSLSNILKDSKMNEHNDFEVQGKSWWSAQTHFVWEIVIEAISDNTDPRRINFERFWEVCVENGIFAPDSSPERKHLGLLLLKDAVVNGPQENIVACFSTNVTASLAHAIRSSGDAYLHQTATYVLECISKLSPYKRSRIPAVVEGLIYGSGVADFDTLTATKHLDNLMKSCGYSEEKTVRDLLIKLIRDPGANTDSTYVASKRRQMLNIQQRFVHQLIQKVIDSSDNRRERLELVPDMLRSLFILSRGKTQVFVDDATIQVAKEKLASMLEIVMKAGAHGRSILLEAVKLLESETLEADQILLNIIQNGWKRYRKYVKRANKELGTQFEISAQKVSVIQAYTLLTAMTLYRIYDGEVDDINILEEIIEMPVATTDEETDASADQVVEILLGFVAKPSKFVRRIVLTIFEGFAPFVTTEGLRSLTEILETKETREGQQDLFDEDAGVDADVYSETDALIDSDVEVLSDDQRSDISASSSSQGTSGEASEAEQTETSEDEADEIQDQEAADQLDAALAAALGTRKLGATDIEGINASSDSDSDADMSDSEMMTLDEKLSEVFRNRTFQSSNQKIRKEEMKSAKENIINFKNRALDMIDLYVRAQRESPDGIQIILPLLDMVKTTTSKQLAARGVESLKSFVSKSRSIHLQTWKAIQKSEVAEIHRLTLEAVLDPKASNSITLIGGRLNVLLCKVLFALGEDPAVLNNAVQDAMRHYTGQTRRAHEDFHNNFNQWMSAVSSNKDFQQNSSHRGTLDDQVNGFAHASPRVNKHKRKHR